MAKRFEQSNIILIESLKENANKLNKAQTTGYKFGGLGRHKRATTKILKTMNRRQSTKLSRIFIQQSVKETGKAIRT